MNKAKKLVKKVKFDFLREGEIGCVNVEVDCDSLEDLKEAFEFAKAASSLIPPTEKTENF